MIKFGSGRFSRLLVLLFLVIILRGANARGPDGVEDENDPEGEGNMQEGQEEEENGQQGGEENEELDQNGPQEGEEGLENGTLAK